MSSAENLSGFDMLRAVAAVPDGSAPQRHVLLLLALHRNAETGRCDPGVTLLARESGLDPRTVQRALKALALAGHITILERPGRSSAYSVHPRHSATPGTVSPRQCDGPAGKTTTPGTVPPKQQRTPNPQKASPSSEARGSRLPADFVVPDEWLAWAEAERRWSRADSQAEAARFVDYWRGKPGKDGRKADWQATWRNWVRSSNRASGATSSRGPTGWEPKTETELERAIAAGETYGWDVQGHRDRLAELRQGQAHRARRPMSLGEVAGRLARASNG